MIQIFSQYVSPKAVLLMGLETVLITASLLGAVRVRFWNDPAAFQAYTAPPIFMFQAVLVVLVFQLCFYLNDLYDLKIVQKRDDRVVRLGQALGAASLLLGVLYCLLPMLLVGRGVFFISMLLVSASILLLRIALDKIWQVAETVVILGTGKLASSVARELTKRGDLNVRFLGFIGEDSDADPGRLVFGHPVVGSTSDLEGLAQRDQVSRIIVALEDRRGILPTAALVRLRVSGIVVEDAPSTMASLAGRVWLDSVRPSWFVFSDGFRRSRITVLFKRSLDICFGLLGLMLSLPLMVGVAIAIKLDSHGPILYRQVRVGWKGKLFEVLKFRSMRVDAEAQNGAQWAVVGDPRVTRVGKLIRKFRLDELPQFINVIRGEMSFVGPRPERPVFVEQLRQEIPYYDERHSVRPGLTGWAQVQYPYGASVEDSYRKLEYDLFYLKSMSIMFDCAIIFQTVRIVLGGKHGR